MIDAEPSRHRGRLLSQQVLPLTPAQTVPGMGDAHFGEIYNTTPHLVPSLHRDIYKPITTQQTLCGPGYLATCHANSDIRLQHKRKALRVTAPSSHNAQIPVSKQRCTPNTSLSVCSCPETYAVQHGYFPDASSVFTCDEVGRRMSTKCIPPPVGFLSHPRISVQYLPPHTGLPSSLEMSAQCLPPPSGLLSSLGVSAQGLPPAVDLPPNSRMSGQCLPSPIALSVGPRMSAQQLPLPRGLSTVLGVSGQNLLTPFGLPSSLEMSVQHLPPPKLAQELVPPVALPPNLGMSPQRLPPPPRQLSTLRNDKTSLMQTPGQCVVCLPVLTNNQTDPVTIQPPATDSCTVADIIPLHTQSQASPSTANSHHSPHSLQWNRFPTSVQQENSDVKSPVTNSTDKQRGFQMVSFTSDEPDNCEPDNYMVKPKEAGKADGFQLVSAQHTETVLCGKQPTAETPDLRVVSTIAGSLSEAQKPVSVPTAQGSGISNPSVTRKSYCHKLNKEANDATSGHTKSAISSSDETLRSSDITSKIQHQESVESYVNDSAEKISTGLKDGPGATTEDTKFSFDCASRKVEGDHSDGPSTEFTLRQGKAASRKVPGRLDKFIVNSNGTIYFISRKIWRHLSKWYSCSYKHSKTEKQTKKIYNLKNLFTG